MLAIVKALQHWQRYLYGKKFIVHTRLSTPERTFLHNQISPLITSDGRLKILLIFFLCMLSSIPRTLLTFFLMRSLDMS